MTASRGSSSIATSSCWPTRRRPGSSPRLVDAQALARQAHVVLTGGSMGSAILAVAGRIAGARRRRLAPAATCGGATSASCPRGDPDRNETQNRRRCSTPSALDPARVHRVAGPGRAGRDDVDAAAARTPETWPPPPARRRGRPGSTCCCWASGPTATSPRCSPSTRPCTSASHAVAVRARLAQAAADRGSRSRFQCFSAADDVWFLVAGADKAEAVGLARSFGRRPRGCPGTARRRSGCDAARAAAADPPAALATRLTPTHAGHAPAADPRPRPRRRASGDARRAPLRVCGAPQRAPAQCGSGRGSRAACCSASSRMASPSASERRSFT